MPVRAVQARHDDGSIETVTARFVLDASGRDTFLGNRFKAKQRNKKHNSTALYGHFSGAERNPGKAAGNITIYWFEHGWFWFIPLADGATSVGAVAWPYYLKTRNKKPLEQFLLETIALCAPLSERLQHAQLISPVEATGNFSYVCDRTHGSNYLLLGDAYTFIDPVFSSGVMLAMQQRLCRRRHRGHLSASSAAGGRRIEKIRPVDADRAEGILLVYLPGHQPHPAQYVYGAA